MYVIKITENYKNNLAQNWQRVLPKSLLIYTNDSQPEAILCPVGGHLTNSRHYFWLPQLESDFLPQNFNSTTVEKHCSTMTLDKLVYSKVNLQKKKVFIWAMACLWRNYSVKESKLTPRIRKYLNSS